MIIYSVISDIVEPTNISCEDVLYLCVFSCMTPQMSILVTLRVGILLNALSGT